jgi:hypothetical protein
MGTMFIGYDDGLVRTSINGSAEHRRVLDGVPVAMVAADPGEPERVYAATLGRGLLRSDDAGLTFERVDSVDRDLVWSVAVSISDRQGSLGAVYAGTQNSALYRSADGEKAFAELSSVQAISEKPSWSFPPAPDTHHVHQITLSGEDPAVVIFGVELGGVFRSADRGETWQLTNADPDPHTLRTHPTASGRMYEGGGAAYFESADAGVSWRRNLAGIPDEVRYFFSLAVASDDPDNVLLSGARDPMSGHGVIPGIPVWSSLYRLRGGVWHEVTDGLPPSDGTAMGTLTAGAPGEFFYVTEPGDVYRSTEGGASFEQIDEGSERPRGVKARSLLVLED